MVYSWASTLDLGLVKKTSKCPKSQPNPSWAYFWPTVKREQSVFHLGTFWPNRRRFFVIFRVNFPKSDSNQRCLTRPESKIFDPVPSLLPNKACNSPNNKKCPGLHWYTKKTSEGSSSNLSGLFWCFYRILEPLIKISRQTKRVSLVTQNYKKNWLNYSFKMLSLFYL